MSNKSSECGGTEQFALRGRNESSALPDTESERSSRIVDSLRALLRLAKFPEDVIANAEKFATGEWVLHPMGSWTAGAANDATAGADGVGAV